MTLDASHPETAIFWTRAGDLVDRIPVILSENDSCLDAVNAMSDAGATAVIVIDASRRICGIITEQDVTRKLTYRAPKGTKLKQIMTIPVRTVSHDDYLYHAIATMQRYRLHHIPVVDGDQNPIGMLRLGDGLAAIAPQRLQMVDQLAQETTIDGLREVKAVQGDIAQQLFLENIPTPHILKVLTHINSGIYRSIIETNMADMAREGLGRPPVRFCVIVMGSGGRGESYLHPDQDNGFILEDYPDQKHDKIDGWFVELADRMTKDLDQVGIPLCNGYVMAINPLWRKTISQWKTQTSGWIKKQTPMAIRFADIFFDFQPIYGEAKLGHDLQRHISRTVKNAHGFLRQLYHDDAGVGVPLGWFGKLQTIKDDPARTGQINVKHSGLLPLVQSVRLLSLREGIKETSTRDRIKALHDKNALSKDEADELDGAFNLISQLLLRHQLTQAQAGKEVDNYLIANTLTRREKRLLVQSFKAIRNQLDKAKSEMSGDVF